MWCIVLSGAEEGSNDVVRETPVRPRRGEGRGGGGGSEATRWYAPHFTSRSSCSLLLPTTISHTFLPSVLPSFSGVPPPSPDRQTTSPSFLIPESNGESAEREQKQKRERGGDWMDGFRKRRRMMLWLLPERQREKGGVRESSPEESGRTK